MRWKEPDLAVREQYLEASLERLSLMRGGRRVLSNVSWHIRPGERWLLVGANGSGKTQLLKVVAGIVRAAPARQPTLQYRLASAWHRVPYGIRDHIAYLGPERQDKYQRYAWNHRVEDLVGTGLYGTDIPLDPLTAADRARIAATLRRLRITHLAGRRFLELSHGERRMTLLARALIGRPRMLLLDEVLTGLDQDNHARLLRWLGSLKGRLPIVMTVHEAADVPASATHLLQLAHGRRVFAGRLSRAALRRVWPGAAGLRQPAGRTRAAPVQDRDLLVRLNNASVYLEDQPALRDVSLAIHPGELWVVHGGNGAGKTTLLRTLYGDHGVAVGGSAERRGSGPGLPLERFRRRTGIAAPHVHARYPRDTRVRDVVLSGRHASIGLHRAPSGADRRATDRTLKKLGLSRWAQRPLRELSYGQTRRVLFARAIVSAPALVLLDEPNDSIDARSQAIIREQILALVGAGTAVVVTAHARAEWSAVATHEAQLDRGRLRYAGPLRAGVSLSGGRGG